jgi:hypothetical protein
MSLVSKIKEWPVSVAFAAGLTIGGGGAVMLTQDTYAPDAVVVTAEDSLLTHRTDKQAFHC